MRNLERVQNSCQNRRIDFEATNTKSEKFTQSLQIDGKSEFQTVTPVYQSPNADAAPPPPDLNPRGS